MRALILGAGYTGAALAFRLLALGHEVFALRRSACPPRPGPLPEGDGREIALGRGLTWVQGDVSKPESLQPLASERFDWIIDTVSSTRGGVEEYQQVYLAGARNILTLWKHAPPEKFIFTSSTSVYGQTDGSWVHEESPAEPKSPTSQVLVETEQLLLEAFQSSQFPSIILRVAGIYGPGRGYLFQQFIRGEATLRGQGGAYLNMIHLEDLVAVTVAALERGQSGEIFNVVDNEPVTQRDFLSWLAQKTGRPLPPSGAENPERKRGLTNKRVSNEKLIRQVGCQLKFPTFREGYADAVTEFLRS